MRRRSLGALATGLTLWAGSAAGFQVPGFDGPESALRDPETGAVYISNVHGEPGARDGNGYISRISASGTVVIQRFIGSKPDQPVLDSPKGLALWGDQLLVADIDKIRFFDKKSGVSLRVLDLSPLGAVSLNGMTLSRAGVLYVSDTPADRIFMVDLKNSAEPRVYREGPQLGGPNGLAVNPRSGNLLVAAWRTGSLLEIDRDGGVHILKRGLQGLDGIDFDDQWNLYVSSYLKGEVYRISFLGRGTLSVFASGLEGPADISYDRRRRELIVPMSLSGTVESFPQSRPASTLRTASA